MKTFLYEPRPYDQRGINLERLSAIRAHAGHSILDVGCGNGIYVYELLNDYKIHGIDWSRSKAWEKNPDRFVQCDAATLPFEDESFDTLLSFETLEHLEDPKSALREYHRVARKNLILTVPNCDISMGMKRSNLLYSHWGDPTHRNFFNMKSICKLVEESGFAVEKSYYINRINPFAFALEALGIDGTRKQKVLTKILRPLIRRDYFITSLVVAKKR